MNHFVKHCALASGLLMCAAGVLAQGYTPAPTGTYFGLGVGQTNHSLNSGLGGFSNKSGDTTCRRRSNIDHLCRLNFDQGLLPAV